MGKVKILYVEDEPFLGRIVKESLETRAFEVLMLENGEMVTGEFTRFKPDLCVLDVMLPVKDGYSIAREIKLIDATTPIIFVTAKIQTEDVLKGFEAGGNDYIRKPFSVEELIVRINNLLRFANNGPSKNVAVRLGQYEFNPLRYELKFGNHVRKLSHREASLLTVLLENRNATTNRKEILLKLWGDDSFFNSRNLDVYITKLRDYLREDQSLSIITIKGIGYHFAVGD